MIDFQHYFGFLFESVPIFHSFVLILSLFILFKSADLIVLGITGYAKKLGLSNYLIGLVIVAMAASLPEIISSIMGLAMNETGVFFGTILGTNMVHLALLTGLLLLYGKKMKLEIELLQDKKLFLLGILLLPFVLIFIDGELSRIDGIILVCTFLVYLGILWKKEGTLGKMKKNVALKNIWTDAVVFLGALIALLMAGRWLVFSGIQLAVYYGIPPYLLALTVIAVGAALPDFAVCINSLKKGVQEIGVGETLGSAIIELLMFFGIMAIINPIKADINQIIIPSVFLMTSIAYLIWLMRGKIGTWKNGIVLIALYLTFATIEIVKNLWK